MIKTVLTSVVAVVALIYVASVPTPAVAGAGEKKGHTIFEIAASNPDFSTLAAAVKAAGLEEALSGDKHLTVFAPTNAAFAALPAGTVESLLKPENKDKLVAVLTYHVVAGKVKAKDVVKLNSATTLQGEDIAIAVTDSGVTLNSTAKVIKTDIAASNGVIHVIDAVILPPTQTAAAR